MLGKAYQDFYMGRAENRMLKNKILPTEILSAFL